MNVCLHYNLPPASETRQRSTERKIFYEVLCKTLLLLYSCVQCVLLTVQEFWLGWNYRSIWYRSTYRSTRHAAENYKNVRQLPWWQRDWTRYDIYAEYTLSAMFRYLKSCRFSTSYRWTVYTGGDSCSRWGSTFSPSLPVPSFPLPG